MFWFGVSVLALFVLVVFRLWEVSAFLEPGRSGLK